MSCNLRPLVRVVQGREHRVPSVVRAVPSKASLVPQMPESSGRRASRFADQSAGLDTLHSIGHAPGV